MQNDQLKRVLRQTLENYERCGVSRFTRIAADQLPQEYSLALDELAKERYSAAEANDVANGASRSASSNSASPNSANSADSVPLANHVSAAVGSQPASGISADAPALQGTTSGVTHSDAPGTAPNTVRSTGPSATETQTAATGAQTNGTWSLPVLNDDERRAKFDALNEQVKACRQCSNIVDYRQQTVFGDGHLNPRFCFMGEAPGADEDRQGVPFVGKAGQLLTKIIAAMKLQREEVYILNALKCRPPQNRTPVPEEIECCHPFVEQQLQVLQPEYLVCLGAVAVRSILQSNMSIGRLRGRFHSYRGAKVVVTYHPSYLLRNESAKRHVWDDMKMLMADAGISV